MPGPPAAPDTSDAKWRRKCRNVKPQMSNNLPSRDFSRAESRKIGVLRMWHTPAHALLDQDSVWCRSAFRDCVVDRAVYGDRKSTRLNSSHTVISYAVFCL